MDGVGSGIISGATAGAIAGLVVSIILGVYRLIAAKCRRKDQVRHIREMITNDREQLYGVFDEETASVDPNRPSPDVFRHALLGGMRRELEPALDGRSSEITFDEVRQIRRTFVVDDLLRSKTPDSYPEGLRHYDGIFGELEKIAWLELPQRGSAKANPLAPSSTNSSGCPS